MNLPINTLSIFHQCWEYIVRTYVIITLYSRNEMQVMLVVVGVDIK